MRRTLLAVIAAASCTQAQPERPRPEQRPLGTYVASQAVGDSVDIYIGDLERPLLRAPREAFPDLVAATREGPVCARVEVEYDGLARTGTLRGPGFFLRAETSYANSHGKVTRPRFYAPRQVDVDAETAQRLFGGLQMHAVSRQCRP